MSELSTTTGQSIGNYPNYKDETGATPEQIAKFKETAVIPLAGQYADGAEKKTKSVMLSELGGLPPTTGKQGNVLTVNSSEEAVWDAPTLNPPADYNPFKDLTGKSVGDKLDIAPSWKATATAVDGQGRVTAFVVEGSWGTIAQGGGGS